MIGGAVARLDWRPLVRALVDGIRAGRSTESLAAAFHQALAGGAVAIARRAEAEKLALIGGCFCNRYLTETLLGLCEIEGIPTFVHSQLPPGDGSLAVGQLWVAASQVAAI